MRKENLSPKGTVQIYLFYWAVSQVPTILQSPPDYTRKTKHPQRSDVPTCVSEGKYLKVNLVHVEGLSLMSSTMKVICLRFSWPPEGLSFTRTSRDMAGFCLNSPASRSILRTTWMVPVTVRKQRSEYGSLERNEESKVGGDLEYIWKEHSDARAGLQREYSLYKYIFKKNLM